MKRILLALTVAFTMPVYLVVVPAHVSGKVIPSPTLTVSPGALDCEGNACAQVTLTFDEAKQQYKVQNNSDRLVRVEASDWAGGKSIVVEAGKFDYLPMKTFVGKYHAVYE